MSRRALDARRYEFAKDQPILVDANILLYLYPPPSDSNYGWTRTYSAVWERLLKAQSCPLVDSLILSEYCNRYLRIEYVASNDSFGNFKAFRRSAHASEVLRNVSAELKQIASSCQLADTPITHMNFDEILQALSTGEQDFNDLILAENCRVNNWSLLTNDSDMTMSDIDVLTANRRLLS